MSVVRIVTALVTALFLACGIPASAAAQVQPGTHSGGSVLKTGWWWLANETPLDDTTLSPPQSSPPNVPKGSLPVSAANGEPEKLSAIEFKIAAKKGSMVDSFVLALRESEEPGVNANQEGAKVAACPVTDVFWADGQAAKWKARPSYDCDSAMALGERSKDGVWRFDLTSMAGLWLSPTSTGSASVVLVEQGEAPESFQVVYDGQKAKGIGLKIVTSPPLPAGVGTGIGSATPPSVGGSAGGASSLGSTSGSSAGSLSSAPAGAPPMDATVAGAPLPAEAAPAADTQLAAATMAVAPPWYAGLSGGGLLLLPFALGLGYLLMLALGPDAQPATTTTQHGVGRALDRLRRLRPQVSSKGLHR